MRKRKMNKARLRRHRVLYLLLLTMFTIQMSLHQTNANDEHNVIETSDITAVFENGDSDTEIISSLFDFHQDLEMMASFRIKIINIKDKIPLEEKLIVHIYQECELHDVPFELALAVCTVETGGTYNTKLRSKTNDTGLFQVNDVHKKWLRESGITDLYDPYQNATAGIWILKDALSKGSDIHTSLMVYNMGYGGAKKNWKNGYYSSRYSRKVVDVMKNLESIANQKS